MSNQHRPFKTPIACLCHYTKGANPHQVMSLKFNAVGSYYVSSLLIVFPVKDEMDSLDEMS